MADLLDELLTPQELAQVRQRAALRGAGMRLGDVRKRRGLSQVEVAKRMGVSQARVSAIETAMLRDIKVATLVAYAEALGGTLGVAIDIDDEHLELAATSVGVDVVKVEGKVEVTLEGHGGTGEQGA